MDIRLPALCSAATPTASEGLSDPFFDDEGDRIGVDRIGTNPVAVSYRLSSDAHAHAPRRQPLQPPKKLPLDDLGGMSRHERLQHRNRVGFDIGFRATVPTARLARARCIMNSSCWAFVSCPAILAYRARTSAIFVASNG
jgi:hypothetical protein